MRDGEEERDGPCPQNHYGTTFCCVTADVYTGVTKGEECGNGFTEGVASCRAQFCGPPHLASSLQKAALLHRIPFGSYFSHHFFQAARPPELVTVCNCGIYMTISPTKVGIIAVCYYYIPSSLHSPCHTVGVHYTFASGKRIFPDPQKLRAMLQQVTSQLVALAESVRLEILELQRALEVI